MQPRTIRGLLVATAAATALVASAPVISAEAPGGAKATMSPGDALTYQFRATEILGKTVMNPRDETLGTVDDLVIGRRDKVVYAVLSVGGFLGLGDKLVAVPYDQLTRSGPDVFVYDATREQLEARPPFRFHAADAAEIGGEAYRERMGAEIDQWKGKVEDFSSKAREKGTVASKSAAQKVDRAWDDVKTQWSKLQKATDESWDDTKAAFEKAWRDFQETWESTASDT